jgi:hypothetical protein
MTNIIVVLTIFDKLFTAKMYKQMGMQSCLIGEKSQNISITKSHKKEEPKKLSYHDLRYVCVVQYKKLANFKLS